jgi:hypothetical protein
MQPNGGTKGEARYRLSDGLANASVEDMRLSFVGRVLASLHDISATLLGRCLEWRARIIQRG